MFIRLLVSVIPLLPLSVVFPLSVADAQRPEWMCFTAGSSVYAIADAGEYLWSGGVELARLNKTTGEIVSYNRINSGLPTNTVQALVRDAQGAFWIGMRSHWDGIRDLPLGGVVKFDGAKWTAYDMGNSGLPSTNVRALAIDPRGHLWVGTESWINLEGDIGGGLAEFDGESWKVYGWGSGLPSRNVESVAVDPQGIVWVGTRSVDIGGIGSGGGLARFDGANWTVYQHTAHLGWSAQALAVDPLGRLWAGGELVGRPAYNLVRIDGADWAEYDTGPLGLSGTIHALAVDGRGIIWVGADGGLAQFDGVDWRIYTTSNSDLPGNDVRALVVDAQGDLWIGMESRWDGHRWSQGLARFDGFGWTAYDPHPSGLPDNKITALAADSLGGVWIGVGSWKGGYWGLTRFDGASWTTFSAANSGLPGWLRSLAIDARGTLWIGTWGHGLVKYDGVNWTAYDTGNSKLPSNWVSYVAVDGRGSVWARTEQGYEQKLTMFDGTYWMNYEVPRDAAPDLVVTSGGDAWTTIAGTLTRFDGANWTLYAGGTTELPRGAIGPLAADRRGNLWVWIEGTGLAKFDGARWTTYLTADVGLPGNSMTILAADPQGNVWGVLEGGGLARFDGVRWTVYPAKAPDLPGDTASALAIDQQGNTWIGSWFNGLTVYREGGVVLGGKRTYVEEQSANIPLVLSLSQNYPNPFNSSTEISVGVSQRSRVRIAVYNLVGRHVRDLTDHVYERGTYRVSWDGTDTTHRSVGSGVYLYRMTTDSGVSMRRMVLLR